MSVAQKSPVQRTAQALLQGLIDDRSINALHHREMFDDIALDSRQVSEQCLFVAIPGEQTDGRSYCDAAIAAGAAAIVYEAADAPDRCKDLEQNGLAAGVERLTTSVSEIAGRFFDRPSEKLNVVGVTGTNGKTTCAWLLAQALEKLGQRAAMLGTLGIGPISDLNPSALTTADAVSVQRNLAALEAAGVSAVCMEVSSHGLDQHRVDGVAFDVALFTNLSQDHLDYHGDMASYAAAKKKLFALPGLGAMVINVDDALGREIATEQKSGLPKIRLLTYGASDGDVRSSQLRCSATGLTFTLHCGGQQADVISPLVGAINLPNLLGVAGCLLAMDTPFEDIIAVLPELTAPPGRMELRPAKSGKPAVVIDYSHTPDSLSRAIESLLPHTGGDLIVVFGCGGDRDRGKRQLMGAVAARMADQVIVTNDNPRTEDPDSIASAIEEGLQSGGHANWSRKLDRREAIESAISEATEDDLVLIAGKGHETTQTIGTERLPFSDRQVVSELLESAS